MLGCVTTDKYLSVLPSSHLKNGGNSSIYTSLGWWMVLPKCKEANTELLNKRQLSVKDIWRPLLKARCWALGYALTCLMYLPFAPGS